MIQIDRWHSVVRNVSGQNETFDDFVKKLGNENLRDFVKSVANLVKYVLTATITKGQDIKDAEKGAGDKLMELAKGVKI